MDMRDCAAEKERGSWKKNVNEKEPGKNRSSSPRGTSRGRWKEDEARTRGAPPALSRLGELPARTIPQHGNKQAPPPPLQQATPVLMEATCSSDAQLLPPRVAVMGDEADVEAETLAGEEHRAPPAPADS